MTRLKSHDAMSCTASGSLAAMLRAGKDKAAEGAIAVLDMLGTWLEQLVAPSLSVCELGEVEAQTAEVLTMLERHLKERTSGQVGCLLRLRVQGCSLTPSATGAGASPQPPGRPDQAARAAALHMDVPSRVLLRRPLQAGAEQEAAGGIYRSKVSVRWNVGGDTR